MVNKVILIGNVGAEPEIRTFEDGNKVARFRIATTERIYNPATKERTDKTQWHTIVAWRGLAGIIEQYVHKGSQIYVSGKLSYTEWQDTAGNKRYGVEIVAEDMNMLGRREGGGAPSAPSQPRQTPQSQEQSQSSYSHQQFSTPQVPQAQEPVVSAPQGGGGYSSDDDDLPF